MWLCAVKGKSELVVCFGELLIDFVPTVGGLSLADAPAFKKAPGGAPANVAVGIARLGGNAAFVGKVLSCHGFFMAWIRITLCPLFFFILSINQHNFRSYDDVCNELDHEGTSTFCMLSRFLSYYHVGFGIWSCPKLHQTSSHLLVSTSVCRERASCWRRQCQSIEELWAESSIHLLHLHLLSSWVPSPGLTFPFVEALYLL